MANNDGNWPPKNIERMGAGDKQSLQQILEGGTQAKPEDMTYVERLAARDGITGPGTPANEKNEQDKEPEQMELSIKKDEPKQTEMSFQKPEPEKDEPEKE